MTLARYLDDIEANSVNFAAMRALAYRGRIDESALTEAFRLLCAAYPVLTSQIKDDGYGHLLTASPGNVPELTVLDGDETILSYQAATPWDASNAVARVMLVRNGTRGHIALRLDHSIADGSAFVAILQELWRIYVGLTTDSGNPPPKGSLPSSPSEILRRRYPQHPNDGRPGQSGKDEPPISYESVQHRFRLNEDDTARLVGRTRELRLSVHAVVCGVILAVHRDDVESAEAIPMTCWTITNLRNRINPPIKPTDTTNFAAFHIARVTLNRFAEVTDVARDIKNQMDAAVADGELLRSLITRTPPMPGPESTARAATVDVSNMGVVPLFPPTDHAEIVDVQILVGKSMTTRPCLAVHSYGGRLCIRFVYPAFLFSRDEVAKIMESTSDRLVTFAAGD